MNANELLDAKRLSIETGIPEGTLGNWRYLGQGPSYVKVGNHVRYRRADVERWIADNVVTPGAT